MSPNDWFSLSGTKINHDPGRVGSGMVEQKVNFNDIILSALFTRKCLSYVSTYVPQSNEIKTSNSAYGILRIIPTLLQQQRHCPCVHQYYCQRPTDFPAFCLPAKNWVVFGFWHGLMLVPPSEHSCRSKRTWSENKHAGMSFLFLYYVYIPDPLHRGWKRTNERTNDDNASRSNVPQAASSSHPHVRRSYIFHSPLVPRRRRRRGDTSLSVRPNSLLFPLLLLLLLHRRTWLVC